MGMPKGKEHLGRSVAAETDSLRGCAQKAVGFAFDKAIDDYFGRRSRQAKSMRGAMQSVDARVPGFVVMAANKDEGARLLSHGLEKRPSRGGK